MIGLVHGGAPPGRVVELGARRARPSPDAATARLGMTLFLGSWAMLFAGFFFAYGLVRVRAPAWPPLDQPPLPWRLPAANTLVIGASSAALVAAQRRLRAARRGEAGAWLWWAALGGTAFLALQVAFWVGLWRGGLLPSGGPYASVLYGLTALHAAHAAVGALALLALAAAARRVRPLVVDLWAMYWHFVGAAWLAIFLAVFLG
jgi:cytochrome c oxidase subunit 3